MSRSNPTSSTPNPAQQFFEWNGENGTVRYYDKEEKQNVELGNKFTFILLDELGSVRGWHDPSNSGIYSNEVRDTRTEPFTVKAFRGGVIAEGIYKTIRDKVNAAGGAYTANCYIAYKEGVALKIGAIQFKGAALNAWVEFVKANRTAVYQKSVSITGSTEGKKGRIVFHTPNFAIKEITNETDDSAKALDVQLQEYLTGYFARTTHAAPKHDESYQAPAPDDEQDPRDHSTGSPDDGQDDIPW